MEAFGLIDAIITTITDSPRPAFKKDKVIIDEEKIISMLEKLKLVIQSDGEVVRKSVTMLQDDERLKPKRLAETNPQVYGVEGEALLRQAKEESERMRLAADEYAKNVLTNLQVVITKMMRTIENGKERLKKYQED